MKLINKISFFVLTSALGFTTSASAQKSVDKVAESNATIESSGDSGSPWFHNAQVPGDFESYAISSYTFTAADFGFTSVEGITSMEISFMQANAGFTNDGPVELFVSFDTTVGGGDYSGLEHNGTGAGLNDSEFSDSPSTQSLGTGTFTETSNGDVDTYTLTISGALETSMANAINNGKAFSIILGAPSGDTAATYAGLESNRFEGNGGTEPDEKRTTLSITATSDSSGGPADPVVSNVSVSDVIATETTVTASFFPNDGVDFTEYGFVISRTDVEPDPTLEAPGTTKVDFDYLLEPPVNPFAATLTGLDAETEYAVRAYIVFDNGLTVAESAFVTSFTTASLPPALDGVTDYTQDFSGFVNAETVPAGWSIVHDGSSDYNGDWGTGFNNGPRGNASVLGFQHTGSTGIAVKTLTLVNNTGAEISELMVAYKGRVERSDEGRSPAYSVEIAGNEVAALAYSTDAGDGVDKFAVVTGLSIADGAEFTITWTSERGSGSGASKQIGISDVTVSTEIPTSIAPTVGPVAFPDPIDFPVTQTGFSVDGNLLDEGTDTVTAVGFVLSVTDVQPTPVIGDPDTTVFDVTGTLDAGFFFEDFTGLTPGTTYSVRAYATSAAGTGYSGPVEVTTLPENAILPVGGYSEDFTDFTGVTSLPDGWTASSDGGVNGFGGDWGSGSSGGFRGPEDGATDGVLGYQHTSSTGNVTLSLTMTNDTGAEINALDVSYLGRVERVDQTRLPIWTVEIDGVEVPALSYSTGAGVDQTISTTITGLSIADGDSFTLTLTSDRGQSAGASRQIGIADVSVEAVTVDVAAPILDLPFGTYFEDQTVFVSNYADFDAGVEVRYTTDGSDPAEGVGSVYDDATGIAILDGNGAVELRTIAVDTDTSEVSPIVAATYTFPVDVADIAAFRAGTAGTLYRITGEVTVLHRNSFRNRHFVRDSSGSLTIWDDNEPNLITTEYAVGNGVTGFIGTYSVVNSGALITLQAVADPGAATSMDNPADPVVVTLDTLDLESTGDLVRINDVTVDVTGDFENGSNYDISDALGSSIIRTDFFDVDYIGTTIPADTVDLIGIVGGFASNAQITPRDLADFIDVTAPPAGTPFEDYLDGFAGLDPTDRAPGADPANDGVPNAAKFVYGGSPLVADRSALPTAESVEDNGDSFFELTITFAKAATWDAATATFTGDGFTVLVESSLNLVGFDPADMVAQSGIDGSNNVAADSTVVLRSANPISGSLFYHTVIDVDTTVIE